jgi:hypothetical protein
VGRGLAAPVTRSSSSAVTSPSVGEDHPQSLPSSYSGLALDERYVEVG